MMDYDIDEVLDVVTRRGARLLAHLTRLKRRGVASIALPVAWTVRDVADAVTGILDGYGPADVSGGRTPADMIIDGEHRAHRERGGR